MEQHALILTLTLNKEAAEYFTELRNKYFPPERNYLKAHLTLFHQLPDTEEVHHLLTDVAQQQQVLDLEVSDVMHLGRGVAYKLGSEQLQQLHKMLQEKWNSFLTPQDKQKLRPHITVQNKVEPEVSKALTLNLKSSFSPFQIKGTGFTLWKYLGGPWELYKEFPFNNTHELTNPK